MGDAGIREIYIIPIIFGLQVVVHIHDMVGILVVFVKNTTKKQQTQNTKNFATLFIFNLRLFEKSEIFFPLFNTNFLD